MTKLQSLREKHPAIEYRGYSVRFDGSLLRITYDFLLQPDITFAPCICFPVSVDVQPDIAQLGPYIYQLGLIELISYWKAACPSTIIYCGEPFSETQERFWKLLYREGLSEFYYVK